MHGLYPEWWYLCAGCAPAEREILPLIFATLETRPCLHRRRQSASPSRISGTALHSGTSKGGGGSCPTRFGQSRRRSSLARDELLGEVPLRNTPLFSMVSLSSLESRLTVGFPVWHLGRYLLARHLARDLSYGLLVQPLGLFLLLAARRLDFLAIGSVPGLEERFEEVEGYGQHD